MEGDVPELLWYLLAVGFVVFAVILPIWFGILVSYRHSMRSFRILKDYAERGEEPPPALLNALRTGHPDPQQRETRPAAAAPACLPQKSRSAQLEQFVWGASMAGAAGGIGWWRISEGGPSWAIYVAVIIAVVLGVGAMARLIAALGTPPGDNQK